MNLCGAGDNDVEMRFTVALTHGAERGQLPTASTCVNKLYLPVYSTEAELRSKLTQAIKSTRGFHEAAVEP